MEMNLKDTVYSSTYGSSPWLMQLHKVFVIANDLDRPTTLSQMRLGSNIGWLLAKGGT